MSPMRNSSEFLNPIKASSLNEPLKNKSELIPKEVGEQLSNLLAKETARIR